MADEIVYGRNPVFEAVKAGKRVKSAYVSDALDSDRLTNYLRTKKIPYELRSKEWLSRYAHSDTHQGFVAVVEEIRYVKIKDLLKTASSKKQPPFILVLDGLEDPQNLGSIIRSAECAGIHGIIIPEHGAVGVTPTVARVASGAAEYVKIARVHKLKDAIRELKEEGIRAVGTDEESKTRYNTISYKGPVALVIGGEGAGIKLSVADLCDDLVRIPMKGEINSLNAAVAAAVMMFEVVRQRG